MTRREVFTHLSILFTFLAFPFFVHQYWTGHPFFSGSLTTDLFKLLLLSIVAGALVAANVFQVSYYGNIYADSDSWWDYFRYLTIQAALLMPLVLGGFFWFKPIQFEDWSSQALFLVSIVLMIVILAFVRTFRDMFFGALFDLFLLIDPIHRKRRRERPERERSEAG